MTEETNYDQNAEIATIAAALMSQTAREDARKYVTGSDFYSPTHEVIWNLMSEQDRSGGCDATTMLSALTAKHHTAALDLLPRLVTWPVIPDHAVTYALVVRDWAIRRRLIAESIRTTAMARNPEHPANTLAATVVTRFASIRDTGNTEEDAEKRTLGGMLAKEDDTPEWIIPDLLERKDRLILTGEEGLGKSFLLRQIAVLASAGVHPFEGYPMKPISVLVVDCENSERQIRHKVRPVAAYAARHGESPLEMGLIPTQRLDLTADRDLAWLHKRVDLHQPDLLVIGPLYRLVPRALQTDDEAAPLLAALDTIRDRGIALMMEAHAGHATLGGKGGGGVRDLRPRGSSALLGWPEFGYGMRGSDTPTKASLTPWRGDRDGRRWPLHLRHSVDHTRWVPDESPDDPVTVW